MTDSTPQPNRSQRVSRWQSRVDAIASNDTALYALKRVGQALLTLLLASLLSFAIIQLAPGNYLDTLRQNPQISPETIADLTARFGLDKPAIVQYGLWLRNVILRGDFGESFIYNRSVTALIAERVPATLLLAVTSTIATWAIAIPLGIVGAVQQNQFSDRVLRTLSYLGQGFPSFITALLLLILAQNTSPLFPVGGMTSLDFDSLSLPQKVLDVAWHALLPTVALSITSFAGLQRIARGELLDVLRQDYIQTARAKGLPENRVLYVHALRNAINPLITLLGFEFASLLGGAFIAEYFFSWPGLGRLILQAVFAQDIYLVMASLLMGALMLIVGNFLADLALKFADPRIRLENIN
ncbi:ABC-type dipeptide/oligopeptide/nickel transport system, permease component [Rubidibacter lacunae KORDI 51-2]|uniref:ABC-type dipeptide/oligopeptide/nickel transport system, permease component n=1 Tax=Rubidibacter lacunae KORDI 51-2 TaxID=582515 RepID=U5DFI6_9CHRO|nr:ABC transporter permease [Rubidibacter lacunae]ERN40047.1 ABC-type dipeptide/oligopeptide/nickel transport system, permease component [Rubidibacter lacunae KORDI 51-2]